MKVSSLKATAFLSAAVFAASVGTANAAAVDSVNASCRATNAKNTSKLAVTVAKAFDGCVKTAVKNGSGSCLTTAAADTKGKVAAAKGNVADGIGSSCAGATVALAEHERCGTPVGGAIPDGTALATCLNALNDKNVEFLKVALLKPDYAAALADPTKLAGKCINAIAKVSTKHFSTVQKEQSKAVNANDKAGGDSNYANPGDAGGKIAASATKLADGITKSCGVLTPDQWGIVRTCDDDLAGVIDCVTKKTEAAAEGLIASAYDQPGVCPDTVKVQIHHDAAGGKKISDTQLDVGWTGAGHNANVIDDFVGSVKLACGAEPSDCSLCAVTAGCDTGNCRCSNNITIECDEPFAASPECGGNTCNVYFGPPLPLSAAGTPTCVVNQISQELVGTANLQTGESDTSVENRAIVYTGIGQDQPCPTCEGNVCQGGARNGLVCTVDGVSEVFGNTSYDCPPAVLANISGAGLKISLDLTDDAISLPAALACDPPLGAINCTCSTCTGDNSLGCNSNAECAAAGAGTCRTDGGHNGAGRQPNKCDDGTCEAAGGGEGICTGETELYCDGFLKADGDGVLTCTEDGDCDAVFGPDGAGDCTLAVQKKCFTYPIQADGTPGTEGAVLVSNFCSAPTSSTAVNSAAGTPGPSRLALDFEFFGRCSDGSPWGPGGANCQ